MQGPDRNRNGELTNPLQVTMRQRASHGTLCGNFKHDLGPEKAGVGVQLRPSAFVSISSARLRIQAAGHPASVDILHGGVM